MVWIKKLINMSNCSKCNSVCNSDDCGCTPVGLTTNFEYLDVIDRDYFYNPNNSFKDVYRK